MFVKIHVKYNPNNARSLHDCFYSMKLGAVQMLTYALDLGIRFLAIALNTTAIIIHNRGMRQSAGTRPEPVSGAPYGKPAESAGVNPQRPILS